MASHPLLMDNSAPAAITKRDRYITAPMFSSVKVRPLPTRSGFGPDEFGRPMSRADRARLTSSPLLVLPPSPRACSRRSTTTIDFRTALLALRHVRRWDVAMLGRR